MPHTLPSIEQEIHTLEQAMRECQRRLDHCRRIGDELNRDITEADLNMMLDRWATLRAPR